jgi:hypothetical protein
VYIGVFVSGRSALSGEAPDDGVVSRPSALTERIPHPIDFPVSYKVVASALSIIVVHAWRKRKRAVNLR